VSGLSSAIYIGEVSHRRLRPRKHALRYRIYTLLIDLDELPELARRSRLFSHNRFNLFSLRDGDFGDGSGAGPREQVEGHLRAAGLPTGGPIRLFAMPRVLGHVFNPISIFFCHRQDGALAAVFYEVHNTFGERHAYLLPVDDPASAVHRHECEKSFHVSPFMDMDMRYRFRVAAPGEVARVGIVGCDKDGPLIVATHAARRVEWSDAALARVFLTHPLVTLKVVAGIHWEAMRLWLKGLSARSKPLAPKDFVSPVPQRSKI